MYVCLEANAVSEGVGGEGRKEGRERVKNATAVIQIGVKLIFQSTCRNLD